MHLQELIATETDIKMNKEELFIKNRLIELANQAYNRGIYVSSDFLNLNEINILNNINNELPPVNRVLTGGNSYAERKIVIFDDYLEYECILPILLLRISPLAPKFSGPLSHRDFLGSILGLGIDRAKIGDIFIKENEAFIYVKEEIADFIKENLSKVKHTNIKCEILDCNEVDVKPKFIDIAATVTSVRLDKLISLAFNLARNKVIPFIENEKVFVNGKIITSNAYKPHVGDIISVRGKGKFIYYSNNGLSKKERERIQLKIYN